MPTLNIKGFPENLYNFLVDLAKSEHRSLTQEVIYLLQKAVEEHENREQSILKLRGLGKKHWKSKEATHYIDQERQSWD